MKREVRTLGLIPARAGSKGLPGKNLRPLGGIPLIVHTIRAGLAAQLDRVVVSTDGEEIAEVSRQAGADVPFVRPAELGSDGAPTIEVVRHALGWLQEHEGVAPDVVVLLQPTSPLRTARHIGEALEFFRRGGGRSVVSVTPVDHPPQWTYTLTPRGTLSPVIPGPWPGRRQEIPQTYRLNGAIYIFTPDQVHIGSLWGEDSLAYVMPREVSVDIDTETDLDLAQVLLERRAEHVGHASYAPEGQEKP